MWKIILFTLLFSICSPRAKAEEMRALLEGPESEIVYGDVTSLTLSIWPVVSADLYADLLSKKVFGQALSVLNVEKVELSENNQEALVFNFTGVFLDKEIPDVIIIREKEIQLMKRSLSIVEFKPEAEQVIIFNQALSGRSLALSLILSVVLALIIISLIFFRRSLQRKEAVRKKREKHKELMMKLERLNTKERIDYLFTLDTEWLSYYPFETWKLQKRKLEKVVYKKEWSSDEHLEVEHEVKIVIEGIGKWSF